MKKLSRALLTATGLLAAMFFSGCGPAKPLQPDALTQRCFDTLLAATAAGDYEQFVTVSGEGLRLSISPTVFHAVSQSLAPRMQPGYTTTYLGTLRQGSSQVSLWRLAFADGGDDRLLRMSVAQERVDGFMITPAL